LKQITSGGLNSNEPSSIRLLGEALKTKWLLNDIVLSLDTDEVVETDMIHLFSAMKQMRLTSLVMDLKCKNNPDIKFHYSQAFLESVQEAVLTQIETLTEFTLFVPFDQIKVCGSDVIKYYSYVSKLKKVHDMRFLFGKFEGILSDEELETLIGYFSGLESLEQLMLGFVRSSVKINVNLDILGRKLGEIKNLRVLELYLLDTDSETTSEQGMSFARSMLKCGKLEKLHMYVPFGMSEEDVLEFVEVVSQNRNIGILVLYFEGMNLSDEFREDAKQIVKTNSPGCKFTLLD